MTRFWKFNSLVGTVGFVLVLVAFFAGHHIASIFPLPKNDTLLTHGFILSFVVDDRCHHSAYFVFAGGILLMWQVIMTLFGILSSFFGAPLTPVKSHMRPSVVFARITLGIGMLMIVTFFGSIGIQILEYNIDYIYGAHGPYMWGAFFVELGCALASLIAFHVLDSWECTPEN